MRKNARHGTAGRIEPRPLDRAQLTCELARAAQNRLTRFALFPLRVARSPIHRLGVFAAQDIPARKRVIEYRGKKLNRRQTDATFKKRWAGRTPDLYYLMRLDKNWALDGAIGGSGAEYINHCCDPNLNLSVSRRRIWLISKRKIATGEELSYDYNFDRRTIPVECHCGSSKCRGTINCA